MLKMKSPIMLVSMTLLHPVHPVRALHVEAVSTVQHVREQEGFPGVGDSSLSVLFEPSEVGTGLFA